MARMEQAELGRLLPLGRSIALLTTWTAAFRVSFTTQINTGCGEIYQGATRSEDDLRNQKVTTEIPPTLTRQQKFLWRFLFLSKRITLNVRNKQNVSLQRCDYLYRNNFVRDVV